MILHKSPELQFYTKGTIDPIMKLTRGKFYWKGKEVEDVHQIYERFNEWLKTVDSKDKKDENKS